MEQSLFYQLSIVMGLAAGVSLVFKLLRQPLIIGYIITGFLAGPYLFNLTANHGAFESFSEIGIVLLLFMIGLGLNTAVIKSTGRPAIITFAAITLGVGSVAYGSATLLGFSTQEALIVATALLFSSTIIVIKALTDKKEQNRLYSQMAIGILLIEDIGASIALLVVSASSGSGVTPDGLVVLGAKAVLMASLLGIAGLFVMPRLSKLFADNQELLYVLAIAWAFGVASAFKMAGFSIEIGALFAGVTLAHLPYSQEISTRLKPLRDFFVLLFFIQLGSQMGVEHLRGAVMPALLFALVVMVTKPLVILATLGALGYTKQTAFKAATHLSQVSEFSIVLVVLAQKTGIVDPQLSTVITLTAVITIIGSAYLMGYNDRIYRLLEKQLGFFERAETKKELLTLQHYPLVLIGYQNGGYDFVKTFRKMKKRYVVIDYNPEIIDILQRQNVNHAYGDATDTELLDELGVHRSELIISNITNFETNTLLITHINRHHNNSIFICHARSYEDAQVLYELGTDYVLLPHLIGSEHLNTFISRNGANKQAFRKHREHQLMQLNKALTASDSETTTQTPALTH